MHYYQHHIGDFLRDTSNLDDHQMVTYLRMIWAYYSDEKPISGELEDIAFAMRSHADTVRLLLRHFFEQNEDGEWYHKRCDAELEAFRGKSEKAKKSAEARWKNAEKKRPKDAPSLRSQCERNANASDNNANEPVFDANQEPRTKSKDQKLLSSDKPKRDKPEIPFAGFMATYAEVTKGVFLGAEKLTAGRKTAITRAWNFKARDRHPFREDGFFEKYLQRCMRDPHWRGENNRNWRADLEFVLREANIVKVLGV